MRNLTIQGRREGSQSDYVRFTIQPSTKFEFGVYFDSNEHFQAKEGSGLQFLMEELDQSWKASQQHALDGAQKLISRILENGS